MIQEFSATDVAQIVSAVSTMIAAIVAVVAAIHSYRSAKQNNETNRQMIRPRVVVMIRSTEASKQMIELVTLNDGGGIARDLKLNVTNDDLKLTHSKPGLTHMSELRVFKHGISALPSGTERAYFILSLIGQYEQLVEMSPTIEVEYKDATADLVYRDSFVLDFASLSDSSWSSDEMKAKKVIATELPKISKSLKEMSKK